MKDEKSYAIISSLLLSHFELLFYGYNTITPLSPSYNHIFDFSLPSTCATVRYVLGTLNYGLVHHDVKRKQRCQHQHQYLHRYQQQYSYQRIYKRL